MSRRFSTRNKPSTRLRARTLLIAGSVSALTVLGIGVFTVRNIPSDTLASQDPMVITNIEVIRDSASILKGTMHQSLMGLNIKTRGKSYRLNLTGIELSFSGSTASAPGLIEGIKLWKCSNPPSYLPVTQTGGTVTRTPEGQIVFSLTSALNEGNNYFSVTCDVKNDPSINNQLLAVDCKYVNIGSLAYEPDTYTRVKRKRILDNHPYYSTGNGDISSLKSWNSHRDESGAPLKNFNDPSATYHIQPGHIMSNSLHACIPHLVVERNAVLRSLSGLKSDALEVLSGGTYIQSGLFSNPGNLKRLSIYDGANYIHDSEGPIGGLNKKFGCASTVTLNRYTSATFPQNVAWGNLVIDAPQSGNVDFGSGIKKVTGDLEIRNTGKGTFLLTRVADTMHVSGMLVINGGNLLLVPEGGSLVLVTGKGIMLKSGSISDKAPTGSQKTGPVHFIPGLSNTFRSGSFHLSKPGSSVVFNKKEVRWYQDSCRVMLPDAVISNGCVLRLTGEVFGPIADKKTILLKRGATIDCGYTKIIGQGGFRNEPASTLMIGDRNGFSSEGNTGNIQTDSRYYSSGANYTFTGVMHPQQSGKFITAPVLNTVNNLSIQKDRNQDVLIMDQSLRITGRFYKGKGNVNKNGFAFEYNSEYAVTSGSASVQ